MRCVQWSASRVKISGIGPHDTPISRHHWLFGTDKFGQEAGLDLKRVASGFLAGMTTVVFEDCQDGHGVQPVSRRQVDEAKAESSWL